MEIPNGFQTYAYVCILNYQIYAADYSLTYINYRGSISWATKNSIKTAVSHGGERVLAASATNKVDGWT